MNNSTPRAAMPPLPVGVAWTLTETLTRKETTTRGYLWFTNPINCCWTALYTAEQMQERDRQVVEHVIRACADLCAAEQAENRTLAKGSKTAMYDWMADGAGLCRGAILALLPVKEPKE